MLVFFGDREADNGRADHRAFNACDRLCSAITASCAQPLDQKGQRIPRFDGLPKTTGINTGKPDDLAGGLVRKVPQECADLRQRFYHPDAWCDGSLWEMTIETGVIDTHVFRSDGKSEGFPVAELIYPQSRRAVGQPSHDGCGIKGA